MQSNVIQYKTPQTKHTVEQITHLCDFYKQYSLTVVFIELLNCIVMHPPLVHTEHICLLRLKSLVQKY